MRHLRKRRDEERGAEEILEEGETKETANRERHMHGAPTVHCLDKAAIQRRRTWRTTSMKLLLESGRWAGVIIRQDFGSKKKKVREGGHILPEFLLMSSQALVRIQGVFGDLATAVCRAPSAVSWWPHEPDGHCCKELWVGVLGSRSTVVPPSSSMAA